MGSGGLGVAVVHRARESFGAMEKNPGGIVFFDGHCRLCNGWVRFVLAHERDRSLRFAALESDAANKALSGSGLDLEGLDSVVVLADGRWRTHSSAVIRIARHLRWPWRALAWIWIIPKPLRDWIYRLIAKHRYRFFGRSDACMVPSLEHADRFLDTN